MNLLLKTYKDLTKEDFEILWDNALFVFDSNVLLDLYRLPENASKDLLKIFTDKQLKNRVWIPFQVIMEFFKNRKSTIRGQKSKFNEVRQVFTEKITELENFYTEFEGKINTLKIKDRHSLINTDHCVNKELFKEPINKLTKFITELDELEKKHIEETREDKIKEKILKIFKDKIGSIPTKDELQEIYKDGEQRYKEKIAPGFMDASKPEIVHYEDRKIYQKFGDLIIWKDLLKKAKTEQLEYIVFVTGDTEKEDWFDGKKGNFTGVRADLLNEIYTKAESVKLFHIYDPSNFMKYAKEYLKIDIPDESIKETKDFLEINRTIRLIKDWVNATPPLYKAQDPILSLETFISDYLVTSFSFTQIIYPSDFKDVTLKISPSEFLSIVSDVLDFKISAYSILVIRNPQNIGIVSVNERMERYLKITFDFISYSEVVRSIGKEPKISKIISESDIFKNEYGYCKLVEYKNKITLEIYIMPIYVG